MADTAEMFRSREFRTANLESQREWLASENSGFAALGAEEQNKILGEVEDQYAREWNEGDFSDAFDRGVAKAGAHFTGIGINTIDLLNFGDAQREAAGWDAKGPLEEYLREQEEKLYEAGINPEGNSTNKEVFAEMLGLGVASAAGYGGVILTGAAGLMAAGVGAPAALSAAAIGLAGFGMGAMSEADRGFLEAMKAGTVGAALFALFPLLRMAGAGPALQATVFGDITFMMTPEEMELNERIGHGGLGATFGALNGIGVNTRGVSKQIDPHSVGRVTVRAEPIVREITELAQTLEPEIGAKLLGENALTKLNDRRGHEVAEREQIANDRLAYPEDPVKAAELEKQIESLPPEERAMFEEIRAQEQAADATRGTKIAERIGDLKLEWAKNKDPKQKGFIEEEIRNLEQQPRLDGKPVERPAEADAGSAEQYKYIPMDVSEPTSGKVFYHGTKAPVSKSADLDPIQFGNAYAMMGQGLYLTDSLAVGKSYAKNKGYGPEGKVFSVVLKDLNLVDMDSALQPDARTAFVSINRILSENPDSPKGGGDLSKALTNRDATGIHMMEALKEDMVDLHLDTNEAYEMYGELHDRLVEIGFDGIRHEGGKTWGKKGFGPHNVVVLFDDLSAQPKRPLSGKFTDKPDAGSVERLAKVANEIINLEYNLSKEASPKGQIRLEKLQKEYDELTKEVSSPREEGKSQGDLDPETTRGRAAEATPEEPLKLPEGDTGMGFRGEYETFRSEFEKRFGRMGEYQDLQLPPGKGGGPGEVEGIPAEQSVPVIHRSTLMDRRRLEYLDDGHGALWMMRESGLEDMPDSVYHHFQSLRGIPDFQDGMVKYGAPTWIPDPKIPGRRIVRYMPTTRYDVIEHQPAPGDTYQGTIYEPVARTAEKYPKIEDRVNKGMAQIIMPVMGRGRRYESDSWDYFQARRSNELINQMEDVRTGDLRTATMEEILAVKTREKNWNLEQIEEHLAKANPERVAVFESMKEYAGQMADFYVETGFVAKSSRDQWALDNMEYAFGFQRKMETGRRGGHRKEDRLTTIMGIHRLHGNKADLADRYTLFVQGFQDLGKAALQNKFVMDTVDKMIELGGYAERISPDAARIKISRRALKQALIDDMVANEGLTEAQAAARMKWIGDMPGGIEQLSFFVGGNTPYGTDVASFLRAGKPEYYKIYDPLLQRTIGSMNRDAMMGIIGRASAAIKKFKQEMITMDPTFIYRNVIRDPAIGTTMTRTGQQAISGSIKALHDVYTKSQDFQDYIANLGGGATLRDGVRLSRKLIIKAAERQNRSWANPRNLLFGPGDMWRYLKATGKAGELLTRVGEFKRARETGVFGKRYGEPATMGESIDAAKSISTNFSIRGGGKPTKEDGLIGTRWGPEVNQFLANTVPFYNAMMASSDRGYRAVFRDPHGKAGTRLKMGMVGMTSMMLYVVNRWMGEKYGHLLDEEGRPYVDFLNIPNWARMTQWDFYIPYEFDATTLEPVKFHHFHTPKLWEVGMIGSIAERFAQLMIDGSEDDQEVFWDMMEIVAHNFNFRTEGKGPIVPLPAGFDIAFEQGSNMISFTGQPIETRGMEDLQSWARGRSGTPRTLQEFSEKIRGVPFVPDYILSPSRAEALLRSIFGSWATMGLQITDQVFYPGGPALGWDDLPVIRSIYSEPGRYDRDAQLFYENLEKFSQAHGTLREMHERRKHDIVKEMQLDPDQKYMIRMAPGTDRANRRLQLINREIDLLKRGVAEPEATPKERHQTINRLKAKRNRLMKRVNERSARTKKKYADEAERRRASGN